MPWLAKEERPWLWDAPISVWWDIDGCPLPETCDPCEISGRIRAALQNVGYSGKMIISAYGKINMIPIQVQDALQKGGIKLCNDECASIKLEEEDMRGKIMRRMADDMLWWSRYTPRPANYLLICDDLALDGLWIALVMLMKKNHNTLLAQNHEPTDKLLVPKRIWLWTSLSSGGSPIRQQKIEDKIRSESWHLSLTKDEIDEMRERLAKKNKCLTSLRLTMILFKRLKKSKKGNKSLSPSLVSRIPN